MVLIPGGEFILGSNDRGGERAHIVSQPSFYMDHAEVTNAAYRACVQAQKCTPLQSASSYSHPSYANQPEFDNFPVIHVTWEQARDFCSWAGKRLPTEAEWEKAASWNSTEGRKVIWAWGNTFDEERLNSAETGIGDTAPVDRFPPEANGTLGMAGNVYEWTSSLYTPYPYDAADGRESLDAPGARVFRGGSWAQSAGKAQNVSRQAALPSYHDREIGFRCARTP
jgi:formylglycine-generating enzyme required for sulfatase activity